MRKVFSVLTLALVGTCFVSFASFAQGRQTNRGHQFTVYRPPGNPAPHPIADTKTTKSGAEFNLVSEEDLRAAGITDPRKFAAGSTNSKKALEAWEDPSGMIWGNIAENEDGSARFMNHKDATDYCNSIGAELPSREDFIRFREYMGAKPGSHEGYKPEILPNLTYIDDKGDTHTRQFWSSIRADHPNFAFYFIGQNGVIINDFRGHVANIFSVRCVVARR